MNENVSKIVSEKTLAEYVYEAWDMEGRRSRFVETITNETWIDKKTALLLWETKARKVVHRKTC